MMSTCSTQVYFEEVMDTTRSLHHEHIEEMCIISGYELARGTLLFGEINTNKKSKKDTYLHMKGLVYMGKRGHTVNIITLNHTLKYIFTNMLTLC